MGDISWFEAFSKSVNVIFTEEDFENYLAVTRSSLDFYKKHLGEGAKILELGCGLGVGPIPLSTFGYDITGIDNDMKVVEAATKNAKKFGKNIKIIHGDIFDIDKMFGPDSFDVCMSGGLLEHFSESQICDYEGSLWATSALKTVGNTSTPAAFLNTASPPSTSLSFSSESSTPESISFAVHADVSLIASMPLASYPGEAWDDGIYRNLWMEDHWLNNILNDFNIVEYQLTKTPEYIKASHELEIVISR